jgi:co-chaperonin GroES (HSP10)
LSSTYKPIELKRLRPLHDHIIVADMQFTDRVTATGLFIPSDDKQIHGVHPRWGRVYEIGPDQKDVAVGEYVLIAHGRWTRGANIIDGTGANLTIRRIDNNDILAVSSEPVLDENLGIPLTNEQMNGAPRY